MATVIDGKEYKVKAPTGVYIVVTGSPTFEVKLGGSDVWNAVDLTVGASYPSVVYNAPVCDYRFTLNGGTAEITAVDS